MNQKCIVNVCVCHGLQALCMCLVHHGQLDIHANDNDIVFMLSCEYGHLELCQCIYGVEISQYFVLIHQYSMVHWSYQNGLIYCEIINDQSASTLDSCYAPCE